MSKPSIFEMAQERFRGLGLTYEVMPACDIDAQTYVFETFEDAIPALSELNTMVWDWNLDMIRIELRLGVKKCITLEQLDEDEEVSFYSENI